MQSWSSPLPQVRDGKLSFPPPRVPPIVLTPRKGGDTGKSQSARLPHPPDFGSSSRISKSSRIHARALDDFKVLTEREVTNLVNAELNHTLIRVKAKLAQFMDDSTSSTSTTMGSRNGRGGFDSTAWLSSQRMVVNPLVRLGVLSEPLGHEEKLAIRQHLPADMQVEFFVVKRNRFVLPQDVNRFPVFVQERCTNLNFELGSGAPEEPISIEMGKKKLADTCQTIDTFERRRVSQAERAEKMVAEQLKSPRSVVDFSAADREPTWSKQDGLTMLASHMRDLTSAGSMDASETWGSGPIGSTPLPAIKSSSTVPSSVSGQIPAAKSHEVPAQSDESMQLIYEGAPMPEPIVKLPQTFEPDPPASLTRKHDWTKWHYVMNTIRSLSNLREASTSFTLASLQELLDSLEAAYIRPAKRATDGEIVLLEDGLLTLDAFLTVSCNIPYPESAPKMRPSTSCQVAQAMGRPVGDWAWEPLFQIFDVGQRSVIPLAPFRWGLKWATTGYPPDMFLIASLSALFPRKGELFSLEIHALVRAMEDETERWLARTLPKVREGRDLAQAEELISGLKDCTKLVHELRTLPKFFTNHKSLALPVLSRMFHTFSVPTLSDTVQHVLPAHVETNRALYRQESARPGRRTPTTNESRRTATEGWDEEEPPERGSPTSSSGITDCSWP